MVVGGDEYAVVYRWNKSNRNPDSDIQINLAQVVQSKKTGETFLQLEVQDGGFAVGIFQLFGGHGSI